MLVNIQKCQLCAGRWLCSYHFRLFRKHTYYRIWTAYHLGINSRCKDNIVGRSHCKFTSSKPQARLSDRKHFLFLIKKLPWLFDCLAHSSPVKYSSNTAHAQTLYARTQYDIICCTRMILNVDQRASGNKRLTLLLPPSTVYFVDTNVCVFACIHASKRLLFRETFLTISSNTRYYVRYTSV